MAGSTSGGRIGRFDTDCVDLASGGIGLGWEFRGYRIEEEEEVVTVVTLHVGFGCRRRRTRQEEGASRALCFKGMRERTRSRGKRVESGGWGAAG